MNKVLEEKSKEDKKLYNKLCSASIPESTKLLSLIQEKGAIVFGASGTMGSGISSTFLRSGAPTFMQDIDSQMLLESQLNAMLTLEKATKRRKLSKEQLEEIKSKGNLKDAIVFPERGKIPFEEIAKEHKEKGNSKELVSSFLNKSIGNLKKDYSEVFMVLEAGPEIMGFKQGVFEFFEQALESNKAIIATNTSSLKVDDIAARVDNPERVVGFHYFLPAHINPLVEIIVGEKTSPEVILAMKNLATAMGKKPIVCWGDKTGAIANRILVGVLNEAGKIFDEGIASQQEVDQVFLETCYSEQIKIKLKRVQNQFKAAPKLSFFRDEESLYSRVKNIEEEINNLEGKKGGEKLLVKKENLLKEAQGNLRQKVLYTQIVENHGELGSFFTPAKCVANVQQKAKDQITNIGKYLSEVNDDRKKLSEPFIVTPYKLPEPEKKTSTNGDTKKYIKKRLQSAYIAISMEIVNEGLSDIQDIELACKEGFKWNEGPFELANRLGIEKVKDMIELSNKGISGTTGICSPESTFEVTNTDLSGVRTYVQNNIGFIELGRMHVQHLQMMQNSLGPYTLDAISNAIKEYSTNSDIKSIIIKSQGGGPFSAGADLRYLESIFHEGNKPVEYINHGYDVMNIVANCPKPTLALIDGPAVGGGAELALACDYRIMTELSYVAFPEVALGIIPRWGGTHRLAATVGKKLARALICTARFSNLGKKLSSQDAFEVGFADKLVRQTDLPKFVADLIEGNIKEIDLDKKPEPKSNYDKSDYPKLLSRKLKLNSKEIKYEFLTKWAAKLAEKQISHAENLQEVDKTNDDKRLLKSGRIVLQLLIHTRLWAIQNKNVANLLQRLKLI